MRRKNSPRLERRLRETAARVERLGGSIFIGPGLPDSVLELFLDDIDDCPICREAAERIDPTRTPPRRPGH